MTSKTPKKRRARTKTGHYRADDPSTPDVNEAWEVVSEETVAPKKKRQHQLQSLTQVLFGLKPEKPNHQCSQWQE